MSDLTAAEYDDALPFVELSDEAIEMAAGSVWGKAGAFTLAFCSGIDSCPSASA